MTGAARARLEALVVKAGICVGCGACVALDPTGNASMVDSPAGPLPHFASGVELPDLAWEACPGKGNNYPDLYRRHYGALPDSWLVGHVVECRTGHAADDEIRANGASGGVTTRVLIHLLETGRIDGALVVQQGVSSPERASSVIARTRQEILSASQSVYVPVSTLDTLRDLHPHERYAITCLPDQSAALRQMQMNGFGPANQIEFVLGPYTGTSLYPAAIRALLRSKGVADEDQIMDLKWRAGDWPGFLQITLRSGRVVRSKKVYYNFLIPFYVTQSSLQTMDFTNEFADLAVGDAWSPRFEREGGGHSVLLTRSAAMEAVVAEMVEGGLLVVEPMGIREASEMHGHMLDFKKRGSYIRNRFRRLTGRRAPDFGIQPTALPLSRVLVEMVIMTIVAVGTTRVARWLVRHIPEKVIGPLFDRLRLAWKSFSKPTKRRGLSELQMQIEDS